MEIITLDSGNKARLMDMVYTHGKMETSTKVNGWRASDMVMELTSFVMVICISVNTDMENQRAMDSTNGLMETRIQECFKMDSSMEKVNGKRSLV